jgi:hypothetical protein
MQLSREVLQTLEALDFFAHVAKGVLNFCPQGSARRGITGTPRMRGNALGHADSASCHRAKTIDFTLKGLKGERQSAIRGWGVFARSRSLQRVNPGLEVIKTFANRVGSGLQLSEKVLHP